MKIKYEYYINKGKDDYDKHGHPILIRIKDIIDIKFSEFKEKGNKNYIDIAQIIYSIDRELAFKYKDNAWREPMVLGVESFDYSIHFNTDYGNYIYDDGKKSIRINSREEIQEMIKKINNPDPFHKQLQEAWKALKE